MGNFRHLVTWQFCMLFCRLLFPPIVFFENPFRVSNSFYPDQARQYVGPDLDPNCLQRLSADDTSKYRVRRRGYLYFSESYKTGKPKETLDS